MINKNEIDSLKKNSLVLRIYGNKINLEKRGREYIGICPFHGEKTGSFSINQNREGYWLYHCFGCGESGSIIDFVQKTDNLSFKDAVKSIKEKIGSTDWEKNKQQVDQVFHSIDAGNREYKTYTLQEYQKLEDAFAKSEDAQSWLLNERGIDFDTAQRLHIGFRQDLGRVAGVPNKDIADKGWISFPCIEGDTVTSIKYRSLARKAFARQPGMKTTLFNTETIDFLEPLVITEGEFDTLVLEMAGFHAVSLPNASYKLTPEMRDAVLQSEKVILAGDCDDGAGVAAMDRLKADFGDRAIRIKWPDGMKDANDTFVKYCSIDIDKFRELVYSLIREAKSQPLPGVYSLADIMSSGQQESLVDHPDRFRFPWKSVDEMAILMPGAVAASTASVTGSGKTVFWIGATLYSARRNHEIVLNYQVELSPAEVANIVAANVLAKDRNTLTKEDYHKAGSLLSGVRYYVGADPVLTDAEAVLDLIESAVKRLGITVVVLDHLHFLTAGDNATAQQGKAMQRIKNMARTYGLKFIVIGQPRKAEQKNRGKAIHIDDMKDSQAIMANSDIGYFLHREAVKNIDPSNPPADLYEPETEIHLVKGRARGKGKAFTRLYYAGALATFLDIDRTHEEES